jgi:outer membrane lipoprotein-sorting protein
MISPRLIISAAIALCTLSAPAWALDKSEMLTILEEIDDRQRNTGDYKARTYIEQKQKDKEDLVYEAVIYRRDKSNQFSLLFAKPKSEAGKGYLRLDKNLFLYDPTVGRWERRTEREGIGGTNSRRSDFDESRLATEFTPTFKGEEKLGKYKVHHLALRAKKGVDVAYPVVHLWIDKKTGNILKQRDYALSGKLMRTSYFPKWNKVYSESKKADVYFPREIRIFDEIEKGTSTTIVFLKLDLKSLPKNIFTKAWIESKSR